MQLSRRRFVAQAIAGSAGAYALADPLLSRALAAVPVASDVAFGSGVSSGQVTQRGITLWTQLDGLGAPSRLGVEVARDPGFANVILRTEALADPAAAGTARVRVRSPRLQPGERYWYRFTSAQGSSPAGRFRTTLPPGSSEPVRIAFIACQDFLSGWYTAHRDLAAQDVDLVVSLGDYIYEQAFFTGGVREVPQTPDQTVRTLDEYRAQYRTYHTDEYLRSVRAMAPMLVIWDDHEVQDNYAGTHPGHEWTELNGIPQRTDIPFLQRRANAYQAFFETHPIIRDRVEPDRTYASSRSGMVELFRLDLRQYKTDQVCNPDDGPFAFCERQDQTTDPAGTILGETQRSWLLNGLKRSTAPWKLIANQVMMMANDILPGWTMDTEGWDGYANDRRLLCDWITQNKIKDVAVITGDIHMFYAGHVTRTGREPWVPFAGLQGGPAAMTEFAVGAITSQGISDRVSAVLVDLGYQLEKVFNPYATRPSDEALRNGIAEVVDGFLKAMNPHWDYANSSYKGYGLVEARADALKVRFRATHDVKDPNSAPFTLASFTVPRGSAEVHRDAVASQRRLQLPIDRNVPITRDQARQYILDYAAHH